MNKDGLILVAEDDEYDVEFLRRAFAEAGLHNPVHTAPDGQFAIDYLSGAGEFADRVRFPLPCLVLLDLKMPRKTGLEVATWIRNQPQYCGLPVIMLSSSVNPTEVVEAYQRGVNAFVAKPMGTPERTDFARMIKGFWLTFVEAP
jgi:CheY-like chemotaxis protein